MSQKAAKCILSEAPISSPFSLSYNNNKLDLDVRLLYYVAHFDPESRAYKNNYNPPLSTVAGTMFKPSVQWMCVFSIIQEICLLPVRRTRITGSTQATKLWNTFRIYVWSVGRREQISGLSWFDSHSTTTPHRINNIVFVLSGRSQSKSKSKSRSKNIKSVAKETANNHFG